MDYDTIIVGAGPAGSTAARIMAEAGLKVLIIEKEHPGRNKTCAGAISIRAFEQLNIKFKEFVEREISGIRLYSPDNSVLEHNYGKTVGITVYRDKFDSHLLNSAKNAGAEIITGACARDIIRKKNTCEIIIDNNSRDTYKRSGKIIIASDGVFSTISKKAGLYGHKRDQLGICAQYEMQMNEKDIDNLIGDNIEIYFGDSIAPGGYAWIFPKKQGVSVGVGFPVSRRKGKIGDYLSAFVKNHTVARYKLQSAKIVQRTGGVVPIKGVIRETYSDNLMIVGDAAGQVSPLTSEGIYYSMISAKKAAEISIEAIAQNDLSKNKLKKYENEWKKEIGTDLKRGILIYKLLLSDDKNVEFLINEAKSDIRKRIMIADFISGAASYDEIIKKNYKTILPLIIKGLMRGIYSI